MFVLGLAGILLAMAVPGTRATLDRQRAIGAARFLASRMALARAEAVSSGHHAGLRFDANGTFTPYRDGNGSGLRTRDIDAGVDPASGPPTRLDEHFAGVQIALHGTDGQPGDPIRLGRSDLVSFAPDGSATSGSVYVRGRDGSQLVVRIFGATGRVRVLRWAERAGAWTPVH